MESATNPSIVGCSSKSAGPFYGTVIFSAKRPRLVSGSIPPRPWVGQ